MNNNTEDDTISIGTHNVRGINQTTDQDNLIVEMQERDIKILGISETKLTIDKAQFAFKDHPNYKFYSSSSLMHTNGSGVGLLIEKDLSKHVGKIDNIDG